MKSPNIFLFFSIALIFGFYSCKDTTTTSTKSTYFPTESADTVHLEVGFPCQIKTFSFDGKSYIYCYDLVTYKKVKLYDENFKWIKTFSIDQFAELGLYMNEMEMITPDSVVVLTDYNTNMLYSFNTRTLATRKVDLNVLLPFPDVHFPLEFFASAYSGFKFADGITLDVRVSLTSLSAFYVEKGLSTFDASKIYDSLNKTLPFNVQVLKPFSKNPEIRIIEKSPYYMETFNNAFSNGLNLTYVDYKKLIYTSPYMDCFDIYNVSKKSTEKKKISSKFTDIAVPTRKWSDLEKNPTLIDQGVSNMDYRAAGRVNRIYFDKKLKRYHVFLFYSEKSNPIKDPKVSPFIWQVYDENFVLLAEREHAPTKLVVGSTFSTGKHLYMLYYDEKTYDHANPVFVRFTF